MENWWNYSKWLEAEMADVLQVQVQPQVPQVQPHMALFFSFPVVELVYAVKQREQERMMSRMTVARVSWMVAVFGSICVRDSHGRLMQAMSVPRVSWMVAVFKSQCTKS